MNLRLRATFGREDNVLLAFFVPSGCTNAQKTVPLCPHLSCMELLFEDIESAPCPSCCPSLVDANKADTFAYYNALNTDPSHLLTTDDICTPMECVEQMLDYVPASFWERKDLRILDPCAGNGNFGACARFKTDIHNLWFNELNPVRLQNCKALLAPPHLTQQDALKIDSFGTWDLVMANPPYSGGGNKNQSLSNLFIEHSIALLKQGGYLCFVTPNNWMTYNNNNTTLYQLLTKGSFLVIDNDIKRFFPKVGSSFTVFVWQKGIYDNKTYVKNNYLIKDEQHDLTIPNTLKFIPLYLSQEVLSIVQKAIQPTENAFRYRCDLHNFTKKHLLSDTQSAQFPFETIHTARKTRYACFKQDIYDGFLVIVPLSTFYVPYIRHAVNVTQSVGYLPFLTQEEAQAGLEEITQPLFRVLVHLTRYGNFNNIMVLKHLRFGQKIALSEQECHCIERLNSLLRY